MLARWWTYQLERFPLAAHGPLIALFSWAALTYGAGLGDGPPAVGIYLAAFVSALLCFLQLRIADEFKDNADDLHYRPYRPVPRGLVTLRGLATVGGLAAVVQLGTAVWVGPALVPLLLLVWGWMGLMSVEFFVGSWLRARPALYLVSHMLVVPLIAVYVSAFMWRVEGVPPPPALGWVLGASFFAGMVVELGRKLRAPGDEEEGVETYSASWGPRLAVTVWLGAVVLSTVLILGALWMGGGPFALGLLPGAILIGAVGVALRYAHSPAGLRKGLLELTSAAVVVGCYSTLGLMPLFNGGAL